MLRGTFLGSKITSVGLPGVQKIVQIAERAEKAPVFSRISTIFFITYPFDCFHCRCYAQKYGIIHFTIGNYTLVGVHLPSLTPQNGGDAEETLCGGTLLGSKITSVLPLGVQSHLCGTSSCSPGHSRASISCQ